ncbi:MAG: GNAT family N-acyltransferase [Verrucomicrobiota bacterium]
MKVRPSTSQTVPAAAELPLASPVAPDDLLREIGTLPPSSILFQQSGFTVFLGTAEQIPNILTEICRQREIAFRLVGEGSGKSEDRDRFDEHYLHLFLWDNRRQTLAGGYRLGPTDRILAEKGPDGLYCSSLFQFEPEFLQYLNPGLELGRSFIAADYQKRPLPLVLLWRGIGTYISRHPRYLKLFGPVSISSDYNPLSRYLIMRFLRHRRWNLPLSRWVKPRNPFAADSLDQLAAEQISAQLKSVEEVSARIAETEPDGKGLPILLKHYLRLNGTIMSFNVDPQFSDVLDALLLVDIRKAPKTLMRRYFGAETYDRIEKSY